MAAEIETDGGDVMRLGRGARGLRGIVIAVGSDAGIGAGSDEFERELERRLLEIGFVEGARVEILHEGFIGRDPIAVRVDDMRVAIRRREADAVMVRVESVGGAAVPARKERAGA